MTSQAEQKVVKDGKVQQAAAFTVKEFNEIAAHIFDVWELRRNRRRDKKLDKKWAEIDRQLRMEPENPHKKLPDGRPDIKKRWMADLELPLQAQTLEVLTADARRLTLPDSGSWYEAHVNLTDEYSERLQGFGLDSNTGQPRETGNVPAASISGDSNDVPGLMLQTQANQLVRGIQDYFRSQYDFGQSLDKINGEAFKYGTGIGRGRVVSRPQILSAATGGLGDKTRFPALMPVSIKDTYLDDSPHAILHEGHSIDSGIIQHRRVMLEDIVIAANKGSNNPNSMDGGWMAAPLEGVEGDKDGSVELLEFEGDLVVPRKQGSSFVLESVIVTVIVGKEGKSKASKTAKRVIRWRFRATPFSSYLVFPYHCEDTTEAYASSPLMKGHSVQMAATDALNRLLDSGSLKNAPPVSWDKSDMTFAALGGPEVAPNALWETVSEINVHDEIGGDQSALGGILTNLVGFYYDVTGVQPARLGEQTRSHTTAFAKNVEVQTGQSRTVDYVRSSLQSPLTRWLYMERDLLNATLTTTPQAAFIEPYQAWMDVTKDALPDEVFYKAQGASGPVEADQKRQLRFQAAQQALQIDALRQQTGQQPALDTANLIEAILSEGGWIDIDALKPESAVAPGAPGAAAPGPGGVGDAQGAAIQALALAQGRGR